MLKQLKRAHKFIRIDTSDLPQFRPDPSRSDDDIERFLTKLQSKLTTIPKVEEGQHRWSWTLQHAFKGGDKADVAFVQLLADSPWEEARAQFKTRFGNGGDEITACPELVDMKQRPHQSGEAFTAAFKKAVLLTRSNTSEGWQKTDRIYTFLLVRALLPWLRKALLLHEEYYDKRKDFEATSALVSRIDKAHRASNVFMAREHNEAASSNKQERERKRRREASKQGRRDGRTKRDQRDYDGADLTNDDGSPREGTGDIEGRPARRDGGHQSPRKKQRRDGGRADQSCSRCTKIGHKAENCKSRFDPAGRVIKSAPQGVEHPSQYAGCNACGSSEHASWSKDCKAAGSAAKREARISAIEDESPEPPTSQVRFNVTNNMSSPERTFGAKRHRPRSFDDDNGAEAITSPRSYGCTLCGSNQHRTRQCRFNHGHQSEDDDVSASDQ
jgi:hypothetical protein